MSLVLLGLIENELWYLSHWALIMWKSALWIIIKLLFLTHLCIS